VHAAPMDPLTRHLRAVRRTAGVSTRAQAREHGVHPPTWNRHVVSERWARPYPGVVIADWAGDEDRTTIAAVAAAHGGAAAGETARWLHGRGQRPRQLEVVIPHGRTVRRVDSGPAIGGDGDVTSDDRASRAEREADEEARRWLQRCRKVRIVRSRWLTPGDVVLLAGVPVLTPEATALSLTTSAPDEVRGFLVDAGFHDQLDLARVRDRLATVRSLRGRHRLLATLDELDGRRPESVFHDVVLSEVERRGYRPSRSPLDLPTPVGRLLRPDIALVDFHVALELDGDRFHRDRDARRRERDRLSAYASSAWVVIIVDHRTWTERPEQVFADLDAAIVRQLANGVGSALLLPPHLHEGRGRDVRRATGDTPA
jgi:hypothetical protein